jgi:AbrB family looped-hinge helix DNA binding protein
VGIDKNSGIIMTIVKVDGKGRVLIPKKLREKTGVREGTYVRIETDDEKIVIEPARPNSEKYFGAFRIDRWPRDLDEFMIEAMKKWWFQRAT